jgi:fatty acid desaturase
MQVPEKLGPEPESLAEFTVKERKTPVIDWYRTPIPKDEFKALHVKSDVRGAVQTLGYLGILAATGIAAYYSFRHWPWPATVALVFLHGMVTAFLINGVHELGHGTVFKTKWLNRFFCHVLAFLGWINHETFQSSHTRHHRYTLHPPDDLEVVLPVRLMIRHFLLTGFVDPAAAWRALKTTVRIARGRFEGGWELTLYPEGDTKGRRVPVRWARTLLAGHGLIVAVSLAAGQWIVPVLVTLAPFYGGWLFFLCNNTQHIGLQDFVPDFRLCCRTFTLNPLVRFLYWQMNYHTEHHMYAAVPCYNLRRLHALIRHDLPPCPHGLAAVWKEIAAIQARQEKDPSYQHQPTLPAPATNRPQPAL